MIQIQVRQSDWKIELVKCFEINGEKEYEKHLGNKINDYMAA